MRYGLGWMSRPKADVRRTGRPNAEADMVDLSQTLVLNVETKAFLLSFLGAFLGLLAARGLCLVATAVRRRQRAASWRGAVQTRP